METIDIVYTGDSNYTVPIIVSMTSVALNLPEENRAHFHLFLKDCDDTVREKFENTGIALNCLVSIYEMEPYEYLFKDVDITKFDNKWINIVCYYRLLMLKILPLEVHKAFYIDGDVIVDTDLTVIYNGLGKNDIASVVVEVYAMQNRKEILSHFYNWEEFNKFVKNPDKYPHFNAGFFLLNVDLARKNNLWNEFILFFKKHPNPRYADQDILNAIIGQARPGNLNILPVEYDVFCDMNYSATYDDAYYHQIDIQKSFKEPKVLHFGGVRKPWLLYSPHHFEKWFEYAFQSTAKNQVVSSINEKINYLRDKEHELESLIVIKDNLNLYNQELQREKQELEKIYHKLERNYQDLERNYQDLERNYQDLERNYYMIENEYKQTLNAKSMLENSTYKAIKNVITSLKRKIN